MDLTSRCNSAKVFLRRPFQIKEKNRLYPFEKQRLYSQDAGKTKSKSGFNDDKNKKLNKEKGWKN